MSCVDIDVVPTNKSIQNEKICLDIPFHQTNIKFPITIIHNDKCFHDCVYCGDSCKVSNQYYLGTSTHKNTQISENVLYLDAMFKMLKNTSFARHKYRTIPLPSHNLCFFCVFRSPDGTSWKFYTSPYNIINPENAYAELANLLSLVALDIIELTLGKSKVLARTLST